MDDGKCQFERQDNRQIVTLSKVDVLKKIQSKEFVVVATQGGSAEISVEEDSVFIDISSLTENEKRDFERRYAYVRALRKRGIKKGQRRKIQIAVDAIAAGISDENPPKPSAVMEWMRKLEAADDNPYVLISRRRLVRHKSRISNLTETVVSDKLAKLYLTPEMRRGKAVWYAIRAELARMEKKGSLPEEEGKKHSISLRTLYRRIEAIDPFERDRKREGETRARNKWRYSLNTEVCIHPMQRLEEDNTQLDYYVIDDRLGILLGRPWITMLIDRYSGYILGIYISFVGPSIQSAIGAVKASIRPKDEIVSAISGIEHRWLAEGIGWLYVFDNGLEFQSLLFRNIIQFGLRAEVQFCAVHEPWRKPAIERGIGLLTQHGLPLQGHTRGMVSWSDFDPTKHAVISFSELCQILVRWVVDIHPFAVNERKIARPYDLFAEGIASVPIPEFCADYSQLDFVAAIKKECTVNREGVAFSRLQYHSLELKDMVRTIDTSFKSYLKFDPEDVGRIYVQNPKTKTWIEVPCTRPDYANGLSLKQHEQIRSFRRQKLNQKHDVDGHVEALVKFQEHIQSLVGGRIRTKTSAGIAKFAGITSAKVFTGQSQSILDSKATRIVARDELTPTLHNIPNFEVRYAK